MQERLTTQIADSLMEILEARGAIVVIEAEHLCMTMRGVRKPGAKTITSAIRGVHAQRGHPLRGDEPDHARHPLTRAVARETRSARDGVGYAETSLGYGGCGRGAPPGRRPCRPVAHCPVARGDGTPRLLSAPAEPPARAVPARRPSECAGGAPPRRRTE